MGNILSKLFNPSADAELQHLKSALDEAKKKGDKTKSKRIMNKIVHIQLYRFHNTIDLWKQGILNFEDVTYPTNEDLITVYNDAVLDAHLTALIESRKKKTTGSEFKIVDDKGDEITEQSEKLSGQWFTDAISHALDSIYYGFSLLQFGDKVGEGFASVSVVPREFVYPQKQIVRNSPTSDDGIPWSKFAAWLVPAGRADDMGLLSKATPLTIYKKAALGSWADYTDLFGTPLRVGKTDVRDEKTRDNMFEMMEAMVSSTFAVIDKEDEVEFVQSKNSDAYETFNQQIERLNSEMSKLILGSTMTMDDGSSRSQSEVHENTTNQLAKSDSVMITNWVNHVFIPWLNVYHGLGITGKFTFDTTEVLTLEDQFERDIKLINTGAYNVPAKYITETYGIPVEEIEIETDPDPKGGGKPEDTENKLPGKFEGETQGFERFAYEIDAMYKSICCEAGEDVDPPLSDDQMEQLYRDIFNGEVTPDDLPVDLYGATGELLVDGVVEGLNNYQKLGLGYVPDQVFFNALSDNAFKFAGAKTFQQTRDMSDALVDENGNQRTWSKFRKEVDKINNQYNKNWLKAEYNNATGGSQMASQWQDIEEDADIFPYLQYKTAGDKRVRQDHRPLNDVIRPIKDSFWKTFYPPNGWNCRCDVIKLTEEAAGKVTDLSKIKEPEMPDEFKINMGEKRVIYSPEHPYFIIGDQYKPAVDALVIPKPRKLEIEKPKEAKVVGLKGLNQNASKKDIRNYFSKLIDEKTDFVMDKLTISSAANLPKLTKIINQVETLFEEYKTPEYLNYKGKTNFRFSSSPTTYGVVYTEWKTKNYSERFDVRRKSINFGHSHASAESYAREGLNRFNSKVDEKNVELSTATHEFFHVLSTTSDQQNAEFWGELKKIRGDYRKELVLMRKNKESNEKIDSVFMGKYASTDIDEFGAESFTEYKLTVKPSKYAKKVGRLIDKYFKK